MRERRAALLVAGLICWFVSAPPPSASSADAPPANAIAQPRAQLAAATPDFNKAVRPLLQRYCFECHGDGNMAGDLDLDEFKTSADVTSAQGTWLKVVRFARSRVMPPPEAERQPTQDEREALVAALQRQLYDPRHPDPGRTTPRRLNRAEYRTTVRDLTGVAFDPTLDFPEDDTGYGFDNIADVLTLPPLLMEKYLAAAEKILDEAIPTEQPESRERHYPSALARASFNAVERRNAAGSAGNAGAVPEGFVALSSTEEDFLSVRLEIPTLADYTLRVLAYARPAATTQPATAHARPMTMSLMLGDVVVKDVEVTADAAHPQWYEARASAMPARQSFRAAVRAASLRTRSSATGASAKSRRARCWSRR
jgi:hypothetical protein